MRSKQVDLTDEFSVVLLALGFGGAAGRVDRLNALLGRRPFDWGVLRSLLLRHRVTAPFCEALKESKVWEGLEPEVRASLTEQEKRLRLHQLVHLGELLMVQKTLERHRVDALCLKGPALSQLIYADPIHRHFSDLDLLVRPCDVSEAIDGLVSLGYDLVDLADIRDRKSDDALWSHLYHAHLQKGSTRLELHWRLSRNDALCKADAEALFESKQAVSIAGREVYTLGDGDLLAYLTLHGSSHCWNRLKWLLDVKLLGAGRGAEPSSCQGVASGPLPTRSGANGASGPEPRSRPFRLMHSVLQSLEEELKQDHRTGASPWRRRAPGGGITSSLCLQQLCAKEDYPRLLSNMVRRTLVLLTLHEGCYGKLRYIGSLLVWPPVYERIRLPASLSFLYVLLGPLAWGREQVRLLASKKGARKPS